MNIPFWVLNTLLLINLGVVIGKWRKVKPTCYFDWWEILAICVSSIAYYLVANGGAIL